jgi:hypothetical protein
MTSWPRSSSLIFAVLACLVVAAPFLTHAQTGTTLKGLLVDQSGAALPGASISLYSKHKTVKVTSDEMGRFEFSDLPPGTYRLEAQHMGFETAKVQPIHIKQGTPEAPPLTITMQVGAIGECGELSSVSYEERKPGDAPLVGTMQPTPRAAEPNVHWPYVPFTQATIQLLIASSKQVVTSTHPDDHGRFQFPKIAIGEYVLRAKYEGYDDVFSVKFQINSEDVTEVTLSMLPHGEVNFCM